MNNLIQKGWNGVKGKNNKRWWDNDRMVIRRQHMEARWFKCISRRYLKDENMLNWNNDEMVVSIGITGLFTFKIKAQATYWKQFQV